jgi:glucose-specific phosphotransferase system IIA component
MFKLFKKSQPVVDNQVYAPVNGELIDLAQVSDQVFASKAMGDGFGVKPTDNTIVAPVAGTITMVADTKHAVGITMANGLEVLIHMGVDTVDLKGAPFTINVKTGDQVTGGQPLATMDLKAVAAADLDTVIIVVITNSNDKLAELSIKPGEIAAGDVVGTATAK